MSAVGDLEAAIVERLAKALTNPGQPHPRVEVRAWPDHPRNYRMSHPHGAALVIYRGGSFAHGASAGQLVNGESMFELGLIARTLREPGMFTDTSGIGIYALLEACRDALLGWTPESASGQVRMSGIDFDNYVEGTWGYSLRFAVPMTLVANRHGPIGPWTDERSTPALTAPAFEAT